MNELDSEAMLEEQNESAGIEENVREEVAVQKQSILKQKQKVRNNPYSSRSRR